MANFWPVARRPRKSANVNFGFSAIYLTVSARL
jgi:hypothetical protein